VLAASSSGIAPVSAYGVAARPIQADQILFICFTSSNSLTKPMKLKQIAFTQAGTHKCRFRPGSL
jgi:hypothetical protein